MNLRIARQHLRVRLTPVELDELLRGERLVETLGLPDGTRWGFVLRASPTTAGVCLEPERLAIEVDAQALRGLHDRLPSREGIRRTLDVPGDAPLHVDIEVDIREGRGRSRPTP